MAIMTVSTLPVSSLIVLILAHVINGNWIHLSRSLRVRLEDNLRPVVSGIEVVSANSHAHISGTTGPVAYRDTAYSDSWL